MKVYILEKLKMKGIVVTTLPLIWILGCMHFECVYVCIVCGAGVVRKSERENGKIHVRNTFALKVYVRKSVKPTS